MTQPNNNIVESKRHNRRTTKIDFVIRYTCIFQIGDRADITFMATGYIDLDTHNVSLVALWVK